MRSASATSERTAIARFTTGTALLGATDFMRSLIFSIIFLACLTVRGATPFTLYYSFHDLAAENVTGLSAKATASVADTSNLSLEAIQYWWSSASTAATNSDFSVIRPLSIAAGSPGRWLARLGRGFDANSGGNVFTGTTNPQGAVPAFGTGNTNIVDTLVLIGMQTNLFVPGFAGVGTNAITANPLGVVGSAAVGDTSWNLTNAANGIISAQEAVSVGQHGGSGALNVSATTRTTIVGQRFNNTAASGTSFLMSRARGTPDAPTAVQSGDQMSGIRVRGYGATGFGTDIAKINIIAAENFTDAAQGTSVQWEVSDIGSANDTVRMTLLAGGNLGIGDATPAARLTVGNGDLGQWDSNGDIIRVRGITYSWPATNSLEGQVLARTAAGQFYYTNAVSSVNTIVSTKTLTDNVATDVFTVALAALARSGLEVRFEIDVTNGTDTQTFTDTRRVSAVNKAGTVTSALSASASATATSSADTLNVTVTISSTATDYTYVVTADTSLGTPTLTMRYTILNFNGATITLL